jgi:hypothetical protein
MESNNAKRVLILQGGWKGHEPAETSAEIAAGLRGLGFEVTVVDSLAILADREALAGYDLIHPHWTMGEIAKEEAEGLVAAVRSGVGLAGYHGGVGDAFRFAPDRNNGRPSSQGRPPLRILSNRISLSKRRPPVRQIDSPDGRCYPSGTNHLRRKTGEPRCAVRRCSEGAGTP